MKKHNWRFHIPFSLLMQFKTKKVEVEKSNIYVYMCVNAPKNKFKCYKNYIYIKRVKEKWVHLT